MSQLGRTDGSGSDDFAADECAVEVGVQSTGVEQQLVGAALDDATRVEHEDLVGGRDGGQAMGDDDGGSSVQGDSEGILYPRLVLGVEVAGGLVENTSAGSLSSMRAIERRCFSPPDSRWPRSPTTVS